MIFVVEGDHVEQQLFGPVIFRRAEYYIQFNSARASCFLTGDDASKDGAALPDACSINLHFVERVLVDEVKPMMSTMQLYSCRHVLGLQAQSSVGQ